MQRSPRIGHSNHFSKVRSPPEPKKVLFFLKLIGIGMHGQSFFLSLLFIFNLVSLISSLPLKHGRSAFYVLNDYFIRLVIASSMLDILLKRSQVKSIIQQTCTRLSEKSLMKLSKLDFVLSCLLAVFWLFYITSISFMIKLNPSFAADFISSTWLVNRYFYWFWSVTFTCFFLSLNYLFYGASIALYLWIYFSLYLFKREEGKKLASLIPNQKKTLLDTLIELERTHEMFDSTFSSLLLVICAFLFGVLINLIYTFGRAVGLLDLFSIVFFLKTTLEVGAYAGLICVINRCQDRLKATSNYLENIFCQEEAFMPVRSSNIIFSKVKSVIEKPVTVWGMVNVSRALVLGTCSSILTFSVLFVQIDNGLLKSAKNNTK